MKLTKEYNKIYGIIETLNDRISEIEEKRDVIEGRALEFDREMTDREVEKFDRYNDMIDDIDSCIDNLKSALFDIGEYAE